MKRTNRTNRVKFNEVTRHEPTTGYVRKSSSDEVTKELSAQKRGRNEETGVVVFPPLEGATTPTVFENGIDEAMKTWRQLNRMEQQRCLAMMSMELQRSPSENPGEVELWAEAITSALRDVLGPSDVSAHGPQVVRRTMSAYSVWSPVAEFVEVARISSLRPAEKFAVFGLLAKLLVQRAQKIADRADIPLTVKLVANNTQHIASVFDHAFPGYLAAGLVGSVARLLVTGRRPTAEGVTK